MDNENINCPYKRCGNNLQKAINKIKNDSRFKPTCCVGPTGPTGPQGDTGIAGPIEPTGPAGVQGEIEPTGPAAP